MFPPRFIVIRYCIVDVVIDCYYYSFFVTKGKKTPHVYLTNKQSHITSFGYELFPLHLI